MIAAHFTYEESIAWMADDRTGGEKMRGGLFDKFGIKSIFHSMSITEQQYAANKVIIEAKDYKGLNFRGVGWTGFVLAEPEFSASGIVLPAADVYTSLQTGVIDATELGNPFSNYTNALHEVTKYGGFPGMHQFSQTGSLLVNRKKWDSLPPDIQTIIETISHSRPYRTNAYNWIEAARIMDVLEAYGNTFVRLSPAAQRTWRDVSWKLADRYGAKEPKFKEHWDEMKNFILFLRPYLTIQTPAFGKKMATIGIFKWADLKKELK